MLKRQSSLVFITDALAANPKQGLALLERSKDIDQDIRDAIRAAFDGTEGETTEMRVTRAVHILLEDDKDNVQGAGRLLEWSRGNFRS